MIDISIFEGDITDAASLDGAGRDIEVAYYLVHAMAGGAGFAERERSGAVSFSAVACDVCS